MPGKQRPAFTPHPAINAPGIVSGHSHPGNELPVYYGLSLRDKFHISSSKRFTGER